VLQVQQRHEPAVAQDRGAQQGGGRLLAQVPVAGQPTGQLGGLATDRLPAAQDVVDDGLGYLFRAELAGR